jgi:hypothetical protein
MSTLSHTVTGAIHRDTFFAVFSSVARFAHTGAQKAFPVPTAIIDALLFLLTTNTHVLRRADANAIVAQPIARAHTAVRCGASLLVQELFTGFSTPEFVALALAFNTNTISRAIFWAFGGSFTGLPFKSHIAKAFAVLAQSMTITSVRTATLAFFLGLAAHAGESGLTEALPTLANSISTTFWTQILRAVFPTVPAITHALCLLLAIDTTFADAHTVSRAFTSGARWARFRCDFDSGFLCA